MRKKQIAVRMILFAICTSTAWAQHGTDPGEESPEAIPTATASVGDLAKKTQNPISDLISLPIENTFGFGAGADGEFSYTLTLKPVYPQTEVYSPFVDQHYPNRVHWGDTHLHTTDSKDDPADMNATTREDDDWHFEIAPFLWATYLSYDASVGPIGASGDVDFTDLVSILDMGFSLHAEARKGRFGAFLEGSYISSSADDRANVGPIPVLGVKVDFEMTLMQITLGGMFRLGDPGCTLDLMAGARYTRLDADMSIGPFIDASVTKEFLDPMVAARLRWDLAEKWRLALRGEAGGFGVDTELTWGLQGTIGYRLRKNVVLEVGYRYFDMELDKGLLHLDQQIHGPLIGLAFSF